MSDFWKQILLQFRFTSLVSLESGLVWACLDTDTYLVPRVNKHKCVIALCRHRLHSLVIILHFLRVSREDCASLCTGQHFILRFFRRVRGLVLHHCLTRNELILCAEICQPLELVTVVGLVALTLLMTWILVPWLQQVMRYLTPWWRFGNICCNLVCFDVDLGLFGWRCRHDSTLPSSILRFELIQLICSFRPIADLRLMTCCPQP